MKVFVSYAEKDHRLVHILSGFLIEKGIDPLVASQKLSPGARLDEKVRSMISDSNIVIVLLTRNAIRSRWVQQEIGCAKALNKRIVPLKTRSIQPPAMLDGLEYIEFKLSDPSYGFQQASSFLCEFAAANRLERRKSKVQSYDQATLLHLPHAMICPRCKQVDVHVWLCLLCGDWVCHKCGETIPPSSRAIETGSGKPGAG